VQSRGRHRTARVRQVLTPCRVLLEVDDRGIDDRASIDKLGFVPWSAVEATRFIADKRGKPRTLIVQLSDPELTSSRRGAVMRWLVRMPASNVGVNDVHIPISVVCPLSRSPARSTSAHTCATRSPGCSPPWIGSLAGISGGDVGEGWYR
jgi:hypothetical protein